MKCRGCQAHNLPEPRLRRTCGARLALFCPRCAFTNSPRDLFCGDCGQDLRNVVLLETPGSQLLFSGGERRTVTVLFSDLCGYTAESERFDPTGAARQIDECVNAPAGGCDGKHHIPYRLVGEKAEADRVDTNRRG